MSPLATSIRRGILGDALRFVRLAREGLALGRLPESIRNYVLAERSLAFLRGLTGWTTSTATLTRAAARLARDLEAAIAHPAPTDAELVHVLAEGIGVLRTRDGIAAVTEERAIERAKNLALPVRAMFHG